MSFCSECFYELRSKLCFLFPSFSRSFCFFVCFFFCCCCVLESFIVSRVSVFVFTYWIFQHSHLPATMWFSSRFLLRCFVPFVIATTLPFFFLSFLLLSTWNIESEQQNWIYKMVCWSDVLFQTLRVISLMKRKFIIKHCDGVVISLFSITNNVAPFPMCNVQPFSLISFWLSSKWQLPLWLSIYFIDRLILRINSELFLHRHQRCVSTNGCYAIFIQHRFVNQSFINETPDLLPSKNSILYFVMMKTFSIISKIFPRIDCAYC